MVIIGKAQLNEFGKAHADAGATLDEWYAAVKEVDWSNLAEMKLRFNSVDYVGNDRYVFNIRGNNYRLVAMIFFNKRTVFVRFIGTHAEYDKIDCSTILIATP